MLNFLLQADQTIENLIVPDSIQKARFAQTVEQLSSLEMSDIWKQISEWCVWTGIKLVIAIAIFYIARWIMRRILHIVDAIIISKSAHCNLACFNLAYV